MYSIDIIKCSINLYYKLKKNNIIGKDRIKYIEDTFSIHINTLYNWINKYYNLQNNTFNFSSYKTNFKYNNLKITSNIETFILNSIDSNNNFNIKNIKHNIQNKFNITLSKASIYHVLHKNNLTYNKNIYVKNIPYDDETIYNFKIHLKNKIDNIQNINNFVSYDEMSICLNSVPYKGWSIKGKNCIIKTKNKTIFNKRFSLGMSIDVNSNIDFTIKEKALNSQFFNKFIKKINKKNNKIIFMDNASIHKNSMFKNYINNYKWNIIYNIPYHSHLNPIEYVFSILRKNILNANVKNIDDLIKIILLFKKNINKTHVKNIFNKCFNDIKSI
jgi:transposase